MKMKIILAFMLVVTALAGCSKDDGDTPFEQPKNNDDVAYLSLKIETQDRTRSSAEEPSEANESLLKTLYVFTFDDGGNIVGIPGTASYYTLITSGVLKPAAFKISAAATKLLVVANPGTKFKSRVVSSMSSTTTLATINEAIKDVNVTELVDQTEGFTMINSGDEGSTPQVGYVIEKGWIDITGKIKKSSDYPTETDPEAAAKAAAEADGARVKIMIERLAGKIELTAGTSITTQPTGATFTFGNWTIDAVNSTFYPFAEKTLLEVMHTSGGSYVKNFYTKDPNFLGVVGLNYVTIDQSTYEPKLLTPYSWSTSGSKIYSIENTMDAAEQKIGNATRVVIKGSYYPEGITAGSDWFSFNGKQYKTLEILQAACAESESASALREACNSMFSKISAYATSKSITLVGTNFSTLTQADLDKITNGGEVIKNGMNAVINWYQKGLNYYFYEIRHDNSLAAGEMAFGKYGVVRNNWYSLTLTSVGGPGTPWYPDIENPGPGDPDPEDPIDKSAGYLGIEITVAPWIIWNNEIGI